MIYFFLFQDNFAKRCLKTLENDICEIGAEQKQLLSQLKSELEDFYKILRKDKIPINHEEGNLYVSKLLYSNFLESSSTFKPVSIKKRFDETQLLKTFK